MTSLHVPVLVEEVLALADGADRVVDGTVGDGGHTARFLDSGAQVLAVDRDAGQLARARARVGDDGVMWREGRFADPAILEEIRQFRPQFVFLDLGVSSRQLDDDVQGFSFRPGVPLDMRMDPACRSAAELLNHAPQARLADVFRDYGDERRSRRLAREVVERRGRSPFVISDDFVNAIRAALGPGAGPSVFARLFQALRIAVNDEFTQLAGALPALREALVAGGRLAVISYHSGEDRIVKHMFREWARACVCPPKQPVCTCRGAALGWVDPRRPVRPSPGEVERNPRSRSATLRAFRTDAQS